jgi:hypothetical protein
MRKGGRASGLNQVCTLVEVNQPPDGDGDPQITGQVEQDGRQRRADRLGELHQYASSALGLLRQPFSPTAAAECCDERKTRVLFLCTPLVPLYMHMHILV